MNFFETVEARFPHWRYGHPRILYSLVRALRPSHVVEIGTMYGYAACYMAQALKENGGGLLTCIDDFSENTPHPCTPHVWMENLEACGVQDYAELLIGDSTKMEWPDFKIDFAYIDGWHSYLACRSDFQQCAFLGSEVICIDDINGMVGPRMVLEDAASYGWDVVRLPSDNGLAICTRRPVCHQPTFSQELPQMVSNGVDLTGMNREKVMEHLAEASRMNGVNYSGYQI